MLKQIHKVKCTHAVVQVNVGFYDAEDNLVGEEVFPQSEEGPLAAKVFHPHTDELTSLIEMCVQQAWAKLEARGQAARRGIALNGLAGVENGSGPGGGEGSALPNQGAEMKRG